MKRIFILILISIFAYKAQAQQVSFYVVADADDWQLYMSKAVVADFQLGSGNNKVIIITLTAGDEGYGNTTLAGSSLPYYSVRERGSLYSSKLVRDYNYPSISPNNTYPLPSLQTVVLNGKSLPKYYYGNPSGNGAIVNYFLRLPDGGPAGAGYASPGSTNTLRKLKLGTISSITSVDGVNTYTWASLLNTIRYIIFAEKGTDNQVWMNAGSTNTALYPSETSDHIYAGMAGQEAVGTFLWSGIRDYVMDYSSAVAANLTAAELEDATAFFGVYNWSLVKDKYPNKFNATVRGVLTMDVSNTIRSPSGTAPALPVTLLSFTGTLKGNNVMLDWSTTAEYNSKEFEVERSDDGVTYRKLKSVAAAGSSTTLRKYNYLDVEATELNYYRLKMVDVDGYTKQSDVVIVKNPGLVQSVSPVNNPFTDHISIRFTKVPKGAVTLRLIDLSGKLISVSQNYKPSLSSIVRFDIGQAISKGIYILQVENEGKQYSFKLLKD